MGIGERDTSGQASGLPRQGVTVDSLLAFSSHFSNFEALQNAHDIVGWSADQAAPCSGNDSMWTGILCGEGIVYGVNFTDLPLNGMPSAALHLNRLDLLVTALTEGGCLIQTMAWVLVSMLMVEDSWCSGNSEPV